MDRFRRERRTKILPAILAGRYESWQRSDSQRIVGIQYLKQKTTAGMCGALRTARSHVECISMSHGSQTTIKYVWNDMIFV